MNCKLEKFWNEINDFLTSFLSAMNCKLEKFWNVVPLNILTSIVLWTVNLKSFEIVRIFINENTIEDEL